MNKNYIILGIVGFVVLVGGLVWLAYSEGTSTPSSGAAKNDAPVTDQDHVKGNPDAAMTLVEYSDFQCPACAAYFPLVKELLTQYPEDLRVVYRHFPLERIHPNAFAAAKASEAAAKQGKFWQMHDILFERQKEWADLDDPTPFFVERAGEIDLNTAQFQEDLSGSALDANIRQDMQEGDAIDAPGTPTFTLNGQRIESPRSLAEFKSVLDNAMQTQ